MHKDADAFGLSRSRTPIEWLAEYSSAAERQDLAKRLADKIDEISRRKGGVPVVRAFATFLPEASREQPGPAQRALATIVDLARELRVRHHDVRTIEVVAGSRIVGLQPYQRMGGEIVCFAKLREERARRTDRKVQTIRIVEALARVIDETELDPREQLTFAVELEPGRFFDIRNIKRNMALIEAVEAHKNAEILRGIVGLNLDVGHYALAGISAAEMNSELLRRVAHVHLSDHKCGHLADLYLGKGGLGTRLGAAAFNPWLKLIEECYAMERPAGLLPLSGLVSLEMESCTSVSEVEASLQQIKSWL
jgi:sugar phosphate isomerase/epimerase